LGGVVARRTGESVDGSVPTRDLAGFCRSGVRVHISRLAQAVHIAGLAGRA